MGKFRTLGQNMLQKNDGSKDNRRRIMFWATLAALIFGLVGLGQPIEDLMRTGRNVLRQHPASGQVVVVGIDVKSLKRLDKWPWPRRYHAKIAENLARLGARRIIFDIDFSSASNPTDDAILEAAFARLGRKVTLPAHFAFDNDGNRTDMFPKPEFRRHVDLANINLQYSDQGVAWTLPYGVNLADGAYPSFASKLSGVRGEPETMFRLDYSIDLDTVPHISAADIYDGKVPQSAIAGKDVIIGTTAHQLGDVYVAPGYGVVSGVFLHVIGAQTLQQGPPIELGWLLPLTLALALAVLALELKDIRYSVGAIAAAFVGMLLVPLALEPHLIFADVVPAGILLLTAGTAHGWSNLRDLYRRRGTTNAVSGLPNLIALRLDKSGRFRPLIAARIHNYPEISAALPPEDEKALVQQIAARLAIGASNPKLFQGDEGIFAWFADPEVLGSIENHLEALHSLFRSPVVAADSQVDLTITFGLEAGPDRSMANRLASALVAADEAAQEGVKWKRYDQAKLKDASWKLSMLSQLDAALESGEVWVAYQPKLDLGTRRIIGAEALVRWTHPEKGPISPLEFIIAAEQSDRIEKLTTYVLDRAIRTGAAINRRGIEFEVSVNLSARLIDNLALTTAVTDLLTKYGLPANRLTLEVTETAAWATSNSRLQTVLHLRDLGVQISIDDYGTGLSTLDYLKKIPATEIKVDRSFVAGIGKNRSDALMVNSTIQLAHSLGQKVVAEGVEDQATLDTLAQMGCDIAQGYLIGKPMPIRALMRRLFDERKDAAA